ncbi:MULTISPECIES: DUF1642 domain-containing protein [unclassified Enterococcus]|uniref:DUF1642 domain-containing protein n=1 Tax=unclassified Enterococcus TaxID=2608891 RepID=UPI000B6B65DF|nr:MULTISPECIES: DUF1642 domain-containing protein [unclassified Enterococcus]OTO71301.1 hypothetical protein A5865_002997 [Enterococcus sp. 12E11_DIV0728]OUZ15323.1 hypothetical protein A5868_000231 [Enterococcus sp. 12F9_DIV0723]
MDKKELIEKIKANGEWLETNRYVKITKAVELISQLDEPQKVKVPEEFDEWYQQIKQRWSKNAKEFALWKICQFGFGNGFEDVNNDRTSSTLSDWVCWNKGVAINAVRNGYEVEEEPKWVVNDGDLVIHRGEHGAKVYFVESVDEDGILLVNGIKDEFFTDMPERAVGDESVSYFYKNFRLLARKENLEVEKV